VKSARIGFGSSEAQRRGQHVQALKAGWKFWEKSDDAGSDEEGEEEAPMVNVSRIIGLRYGKDEEDRLTGVEYKLRWEDGFEDSWEPAEHVAEDLQRIYQEGWWAAARKADDFTLREYLAGGEEVLLNTVDKEGRTALHYTCGKGNVNVVKTLLGFGAKVNIKDEAGFTPLHIASGYLHNDIVKALLGAGGDPDIKDRLDRTPMDLAFDLKRRLPQGSPEYFRRRNQIEDVLLALVGELYSEIPVLTVLDDRRVKVATGAVVKDEDEVKEGEVVEHQYLVRWADWEEGDEDEWVREEFIAEDLVEDYVCGLEHVNATAILQSKILDGVPHYLVQWEDGAAPSWEPGAHVSDSLRSAFDEANPLVLSADSNGNPIKLQMASSGAADE